MLYPTPYGALTQLYAGTMPEAIKYNGEVSQSNLYSDRDWPLISIQH